MSSEETPAVQGRMLMTVQFDYKKVAFKNPGDAVRLLELLNRAVVVERKGDWKQPMQRAADQTTVKAAEMEFVAD